MKDFIKGKYYQVFTSRRLTFKDRLALAIPTMPAYLVSLLLFTVMFKYFTDVSGLDPLLVGTVFMLLSIWNAVNDPLIGILLDRMPYIENKGKYLYVAKLSVPFICIPIFVLLFVQASWHESFIYMYMLSMLVIYEAGATAYGTSINSYVFVRLQDTQERMELSLLGTYISYIFSAVITLIPLLMFVDDRPSTFITPAIMIVLTLNAILFWVSLRKLKDSPEFYNGNYVNEDAKLAQDMVLYTKDVIKSKGFWISSAISFLLTLSVAYYFTDYLYFVDDILNISGFHSFLIDTGNGILAFLFLPVIPAITRRIGVKYACALSIIPSIIGFGLLFFVQGPVLLAFSFLLIVISNTSVMVTLGNPLMFLIIDEDWQRTGTRKVGYISALKGLVTKPANGTRALIFGAILSYYGYSAGVAEQSARALHGIRIATAVVPFILLITALFLVAFLPYNFKREKEIIAKREEMEKELGHTF